MSGAAFMKFSADGATVAQLGHAQMRLDASGSAYLAAGNPLQMGVTEVYANGASAWTALLPCGYAQAMAFGSQQQVYVTGGSTARINLQAVSTLPPPPSPVVTAAALRLTLVDAPDPVRVGARMTLTATVVNAGPSAAGLVVLNTALLSGVSFLGVVSSQGSCSGTSSLSCALGSLANGARAVRGGTPRTRVRGGQRDALAWAPMRSLP